MNHYGNVLSQSFNVGEHFLACFAYFLVCLATANVGILIKKTLVQNKFIKHPVHTIICCTSFSKERRLIIVNIPWKIKCFYPWHFEHRVKELLGDGHVLLFSSIDRRALLSRRLQIKLIQDQTWLKPTHPPQKYSVQKRNQNFAKAQHFRWPCLRGAKTSKKDTILFRVRGVPGP